MQYAALGTIFFVGFKSFNLARDDDGDDGDDDDDGDGGDADGDANGARHLKRDRKLMLLCSPLSPNQNPYPNAKA